MERFLEKLLAAKGVDFRNIQRHTLHQLADDAKVVELSKQIQQSERQIMDIFMIYWEREAFKEAHISLANANVRKAYNFQLNLEDFPNIKILEIRNVDSIGLEFNSENQRLFGKPTKANQVDLEIVFVHKDDTEAIQGIKKVPFIINADPKDLWKNIPSDKSQRFAKEDEESFQGAFLDKKIVVASKRGRSHAHEGSFREDHYRVFKLPNDWAIIAVADGAGSSRYSRQGSKIATEYITDCFDEVTLMSSLDASVEAYFRVSESSASEEKIQHKKKIINSLYKEGVLKVHNRLKSFIAREEISLKDIHTTLIFVLCKKFDFGYVMLSFGVGDCPINLIDHQQIKLLNTLDVGEFGGGTRFVSMPEIYTNDIINRFAINVFDDFDKLFLMTDGIYDPKFVVENRLEDRAAWESFMKDLAGENEDEIKVDFENDENISTQLLQWMDFWSRGNHDDRTLAIVY